MIIFERIRWRNLLSTGNQWTEVVLNDAKAKLFVGKNGHGKSTILDALCFVLYKNAFREINLPQLINSKNGKSMLVEVEFSIGSNKYMVRRGSKPAVFDIIVNGSPLKQESTIRNQQEILAEDILKMDFKSFKQVVILGSRSFKPFMTLKASERREVIEDLLGLKIFSAMNAVVKKRIDATNRELEDAKMEIRWAKENIELEKKRTVILKESNVERIATLNEKIAETEIELAKETFLKTEKQTEIDALRDTYGDESDVMMELHKCNTLSSKIESRIEHFDDEVHFLNNHDNCPTCKQDIGAGFSAESINDYSKQKEEAKSKLQIVNKKIDKLNQRLREISEIKYKINEIKLSQAVHNTNITTLTRNHSEYLNEINRLQSKNETIDANKEDLKKWQKLLREQNALHEKLTTELEVRKAAAILLKDSGYKSQMIKKYIPTINTLINKNLAALDFYCKFELDEMFNETIKSQYRDTFSYGSFSEGQKLRIDLAILFAWRAIAKSRNSAATNLLIMDEIFESSLDIEGLEEVLTLINKLTGETNTIIISPRGDQMADKFEAIYRFVFNKNFSKMEKVK